MAQLRAGNHRRADEVVPLLAAAEELPLRAASLDLVTAFNYVHTSTSARSWPPPPGCCRLPGPEVCWVDEHPLVVAGGAAATRGA